MSSVQSLLKKVLTFCLWLVAVLTVLWSCFAIWIDSGLARGVKVVLIIFILLLTSLAILKIRPLHRATLVPFTAFSVVALWWLAIPASNDRDWAAPYTKLSSMKIDGRKLEVKNLRNFHYSPDGAIQENWEDREYKLDDLEGVDLIFSFWGPKHIAHTILSWQFKNSKPLAISIETRREKNEGFSGLHGFFRRYELYYVVADESDVIKLRTSIKKEDVYLYRLKIDPLGAKNLLLDYAHRVEQLHDKPRWYNAATQNCTTTIRYHAQSIDGGGSWNWRLLLNGYLPELCHQRGIINNETSFTEIRKRSYISPKTEQLRKVDEFSKFIRDDLPERPH